MKIGITTFGCDGGKSGVSQYLINLLREFSTMPNGPAFEILAHRSERDIFVPPPGSMASIDISDRLRNPVLNVAWHQAALPRWCKRQGYDVLFLPAGNRRIPGNAPCPIVGTVHDLAALHVSGKYDPARMFYNRRVLPYLIRKLTQVITISESSRRDILEYTGVPEDRVTVVPQGADHQRFFPKEKEQAAMLSQTRYGVRPPYILYIARIEHPGKNHVRLIRAFERAKAAEMFPHQLVLAGKDWGRSAEVHQVAQESQFADDILFPGFVNQDHLPDLYCGSDLFVFPSLYEGFGLPVVEAMACGVPTACANVSSLPEVAGNATELFDPYEEEDIERAIKNLITNSALRTQCVQRGFVQSQKYSWSNVAASTLGILRAVAK